MEYEYCRIRIFFTVSENRPKYNNGCLSNLIWQMEFYCKQQIVRCKRSFHFSWENSTRPSFGINLFHHFQEESIFAYQTNTRAVLCSRHSHASKMRLYIISMFVGISWFHLCINYSVEHFTVSNKRKKCTHKTFFWTDSISIRNLSHVSQKGSA